MKGFGTWQLRTFLASLMKVPTAWQMASILFTAPDPGQFWCSTNHTRDPCSSPCEQYDFSGDSVTFITQWDLVCDRQYLVPLSQVCYLCGVLFGGILCNILLRWFSPRNIYMGGMIMQVASGLAEAFSSWYELQCFLRFITATACTCSFSCGYIICSDMKIGQTRTVVSACYEHMWSVGVITLAGLGYIFDNWIHLQLAISLPTVLIILTYPWIPDSPTWIINKEKENEIKAHQKEAAAARDGTKDFILDIKNPYPKKQEVTWCEMLTMPNCFALHIVWISTVVTYYGALLNAKSFGPNVHLNTAVVGVAEILGVLIGLGLILWFNNEKWIVLGSIMLVGGSACTASWALPKEDYFDREWKMLGLGVLGKVAVAVSLTVIQVTSGELLPKVGIFSCVTIARFFLLSAPYIGYLAIYGDSVSLSAFGGITVVGGIAAFFIKKPIQNTQQQSKQPKEQSKEQPKEDPNDSIKVMISDKEQASRISGSNKAMP